MPDEPDRNLRVRARNRGVRAVSGWHVRRRARFEGVQTSPRGFVSGQRGVQLVGCADAVSHRDVRRGPRRRHLHRLPDGIVRRERRQRFVHHVRAGVFPTHRKGDVRGAVQTMRDGHAIRGGRRSVHPLPARPVRRQGGHARVHHVPAWDVQPQRG